MKKILTGFIFLYCIQSLYPQLNPGAWMVGGSVSTGTSTSEAKGFQFLIASYSGYFPVKNFAIGIIPVFNSVDNGKQEGFTSFYLGPYVRYYVGKSNIKIFGELTGGYKQFRFYNPSSPPFKNTSINFRPSIGFSFFLNNHVALEGKMNYEVENYQLVANPQRRALFFDMGFQAYLNTSKQIRSINSYY
jgi:hypothetical protein